MVAMQICPFSKSCSLRIHFQRPKNNKVALQEESTCKLGSFFPPHEFVYVDPAEALSGYFKPYILISKWTLHWISKWGAFELVKPNLHSQSPENLKCVQKLLKSPIESWEYGKVCVCMFSAANQTVDRKSGNLISSLCLGDLKDLLDVCITCRWHAHTKSEWEGAGQHTYGVGKLEIEHTSRANCFLPTYWQCQSLFLRLRSLVFGHYYSFQFVHMWKCDTEWNAYGIF